jgi:hypothetical protein
MVKSFSRLPGAIVVVALLVFATSAPLSAQGPVSALNIEKPVLSASGQTGLLAYLNKISNNTQSAWNAAVNTFSAPPQQVGPLSNGSGQTNLPGSGPVVQVGTYTQDLVIPNGIPVIGGWNTGIQTRVDVEQDAQGKRYAVAVDPLSAFNYALTHPTNASGVWTGYAGIAGALGNWFGNGSSSSNTSDAFRWDPGLVAALNATFGQGLGQLFGVAVYEYPADTPTGVTGGDAGLSGVADVSQGVPPPVPPPLPSGGEEVYLKAVIPQAPPDFTLAFQPPFPVVVGQDPTQRGVDVTGQATLHPCTVIWHHVLHEYWYYCGPNKPSCDCSKEDCEVRETTKEWDTTQLEPDALASAGIDAVLSPASVAYINGPLAQRYPGAHVYQGQVRVYPSQWASVTQNYIGIPSGWAFQALRVPFEDPGKWDFHVALTTTGTPHCSPLNWSKDFPGVLTVWLREQRLTK